VKRFLCTQRVVARRRLCQSLRELACVMSGCTNDFERAITPRSRTVCKTAEEWKIPSLREYEDSYAHSIRSSMRRERDGREDSVQPFAFFLCKSLCIMRFSAESYSKFLLLLFLPLLLRKHIRGKMTSVHPCLNVSHP